MTHLARRLAVTVSVLSAACGSNSSPPADIAAEAEAIRARGAEMLAAENARDMAKAITYYADDAVLQGPGMPPVEGIAAIRSIYEARENSGGPETEGKVLTQTVTVAASGDLAWEHGTSLTTIRLPTGDVLDYGKHIMVWRKVQGEWYLAGMSWSSDKPQTR